jgi:hypothetical protein
MMRTLRFVAYFAIAAISGCAEGAESGTSNPRDAGADAAASDAAADAAASDAAADGGACVKAPKTSLEILNACTDDDVEAIDKQPVLPLLLEDGGLPPLP